MNPFFIFGVIILFLIISIIYANFMSTRQTQKLLYSKSLIAPPWADEETKKYVEQFNNAWPIAIEETVHTRMTEANQTLSNQELHERWYELKKFLFLAGISKGLPMFSEKVDELWHLFLEESKVYEQFCIDFIGEQIEHHPHEKPKNLPTERAWFDLLYLSFFTITSHSYLWGEFLQQKKEHEIWTERISKDSESILKSFGRHTARTESLQTLVAFLQFARKQMTTSNQAETKRVQYNDGYWYGAALFSLYSSDSLIPLQKKKEANSVYADSSAGYTSSPEPTEDWDKMNKDVNTFEHETDHGSTTSTSSDDGNADSGSSCSSCSGCSS